MNLNKKDYMKLVRIQNYLRATKNNIPKISAVDNQTIKWYIDSSFVVHNDIKSYTGAIMALGKSAIIFKSTKQKENTQWSTESKMVAVDDTIATLLLTKHFIEAHGHKVNASIIYQDDTRAMKLEINGKASSGKRT